MLYFKHSELVSKYHVSLKTVHNWIDASKTGKLDLELYDKGGRKYVANNHDNLSKLNKLAEQGKKYRNARFHKTVVPKPEFYETFSRRQIFDIISHLNIHREIPRQYNYLDGGATHWDKWINRLSKETSPNMYNSTVELLNNNLDSIQALLGSRKKINVIDVGVGNALPVRGLLTRLLEEGVLHRYIAIDISDTMLNIAKKNINEWFGDDIKFEGHLRDISFERFDDLVVDDMLDNDADDTVNLVLLLGATPLNFRSFADVLKVIYGSMGERDLLLYTCKPDTEYSRKYFDFGPVQNYEGLSPNHRLVLDLLNIDDSLYEVERGFDGEKKMRYIRVRLKTSLTIKFNFGKSERSVQLEKGDTILLLRVWHMNAIETVSTFEEIGFILLQSNMTKDRERLLTISGIDSRSEFAMPA